MEADRGERSRLAFPTLSTSARLSDIRVRLPAVREISDVSAGFRMTRPTSMRIFLSAGEPSGDLHAANLVKALKERFPEAEFVGFGGPHLERSGARVLYPLVELAVMWFGRVLLNLHKFFRLAWEAERYFRDEKPDAVVLIDYPGFHWALAKRAKRQGVPVVYFVPPQIWAWAGWRVKKMKRYVDHVLCTLPFEPSWYHERGVSGATYIGHPYFDELQHRTLDPSFLDAQRTQDGPIIALLPGSRTQEVTRNLPVMLRAADNVHRRLPNARFLIACLHEKHAALARELIERSGLSTPHVEVFAGRTPELIRLAEVAWAVSGSVGLELMNEALPTVVLYTVKRFDLWVARWFIKTKYISLVNLLADDEVMPEYLTPVDASPDLARWAIRWLEHPEERAKASRTLADLRDRVAQPGATERAADRIASIVLGPSPEYRGLHHPPVDRLETHVENAERHGRETM